MKRKIVKHGSATLTVSLPAKWAKKYGVSAGDEIEVNEKSKDIILSVEKKPEAMETEIDVTGLDRTSIMLRIRSCYRRGYNSIKVKYSSYTSPHFRIGKEESVLRTIHREIDRLIGVEIIQERPGFVVIKDYSASSTDELNPSIRRIFLMTLDLSNDFLNAIKNADREIMASIEEKHDTISKLVSYSLRLLNKKGHPDSQKTAVTYHILHSVDMILDIFKYSSRDIASFKSIKLKKATGDIVSMISKSIRAYYDFFYKYENKKAAELNRNRDYVKSKIKNVTNELPENENLLVMNLEHILEIIWDMMLARMSLD